MTKKEAVEILITEFDGRVRSVGFGNLDEQDQEMAVALKIVNGDGELINN
jgi:hypothetical protein